MSSRHLPAALVATLLGLFCCPVATLAAPLSVSTTMSSKTVRGAPGKGTVLAYNTEKGNTNTFTRVVNNFLNPSAVGPGTIFNGTEISATIPGVPADKVPKFSPPVGLKNFDKALNTGVVPITASAESRNDGTPFRDTLSALALVVSKPNGPIDLIVGANTVAKDKAYAAAQAIDPVPIGPGTLEFNPEVLISLSFRPGDLFAGTEMGEQLASFANPLWNLSVYATGEITSNSDLIISFTTNPSLSLSQRNQLLGLNSDTSQRTESQIETDLRSAFFPNSDGTWGMSSPLALFDGSYTVPSSDVYSDYATGVIGTEVPEPASLVLVLSGFASAAGAALLRRWPQYRARPHPGHLPQK